MAKIVLPEGRQIDLYRVDTRFMVAVIGRQFGKSTTGLVRMARKMTEKHNQRGIWISPIYQQAREQFTRFQSSFDPLIKSVNKSYQEIDLISGSRIEFRSGDNPDSLRGGTYDHAVLDETADIKQEVWLKVVRPMLAVKGGSADFYGTPKGSNWFKDLYYKAQDLPGWTHFHAKSDDSPFFSSEEMENARRELPERVFRQEYLAEFLDDASDVFRGVRDCVFSGNYEEPSQKDNYVLGVDIAKLVDWTVCTVVDPNRKQLIYMERWQKIDYPATVNRIYEIARKYNAPIVLDATGAGQPVLDALNIKGARVIPVTFTNQSKASMIENLSWLIENRQIMIPDIASELINELLIFGFETLPSGTIRYTAPSGYHDDCVMSLALACRDMRGVEAFKSLGRIQTRR